MERTSESGGGRTGGALSRPDRLEPVPANLSLWRAARPADRAAFRDGPRGATLLHPTHGERRLRRSGTHDRPLKRGPDGSRGCREVRTEWADRKRGVEGKGVT